jgi:hypothetical protein
MQCTLSLTYQSSLNDLIILWGDETLGRHALLSRGWGIPDKRSIEPTLPCVRPTRVDH